MAKGDLHPTGTICKAEKQSCPYGEDTHFKTTNDLVEYTSTTTDVPVEKIYDTLKTGTSLKETIKMAEEGLLKSGSFNKKENPTNTVQKNLENLIKNRGSVKTFADLNTPEINEIHDEISKNPEIIEKLSEHPDPRLRAIISTFNKNPISDKTVQNFLNGLHNDRYYDDYDTGFNLASNEELSDNQRNMIISYKDKVSEEAYNGMMNGLAKNFVEGVELQENVEKAIFESNPDNLEGLNSVYAPRSAQIKAYAYNPDLVNEDTKEKILKQQTNIVEKFEKIAETKLDESNGGADFSKELNGNEKTF